MNVTRKKINRKTTANFVLMNFSYTNKIFSFAKRSKNHYKKFTVAVKNPHFKA